MSFTEYADYEGMMFVGRFGAEELLYSLAGQLEKALPWKERRPLVWG